MEDEEEGIAKTAEGVLEDLDVNEAAMKTHHECRQ